MFHNTLQKTNKINRYKSNKTIESIYLFAKIKSAHRQFGLGHNVDAVHLLIRMKLANVPPDFGALSQQSLAIGTLKMRCRAALVPVVPCHMAAMLVRPETSGTRMSHR